MLFLCWPRQGECILLALAARTARQLHRMIAGTMRYPRPALRSELLCSLYNLVTEKPSRCRRRESCAQSLFRTTNLEGTRTLGPHHARACIQFKILKVVQTRYSPSSRQTVWNGVGTNSTDCGSASTAFSFGQYRRHFLTQTAISTNKKRNCIECGEQSCRK